jgi:CheY-like chemotaxis protein
MDPGVMQKAFDPFFTTKPKGRGTGLGLATVYGIVKSAGGHINLLSKQGFGTTFEIIYPVANEAPAPVTPAPQERIIPHGNGETILLVEDDESVRAVTKKLLERRGYSVIETAGPKDALTILNVGASLVDLMLTDIVMPDMTGVELAQRALNSQNTLKVVYMSGYSPGVFSNAGAELEGELIQKPFEESELLQVVRRTLDDPIDHSIG